MNNIDILAVLKTILAKNLPDTDLSGLTDDTKLNTIDGLTSLVLVMVLYDAENQFCISIDDPTDLKTIGDLLSYVSARIA